ncbi:MAG TPA: HAD family hydrolase [Spirochaetota bacterium]|nr:HAD family hydrolase [Spirochaetota bacterium]HPI90948.1 HAD family hydrolase [Spirochaetota bacterium]HPR47306.1 HAD family hydrolase [Spirochaetota bacterium]
MTSSKTHLAFDIDGTLFDVSPIAVTAFERGIESYLASEKTGAITVPAHDEIIALLGTPIEEIFDALFPLLNGKERALLNDHCTRAFADLINRGGGALIEGVAATLAVLHEQGRAMVVASNGRPEYIEAILGHHGIIGFFNPPFVYLGPGVPDKNAIVQEYAKKTGADDLLIMIGDRGSDYEAARANGIPFIGCAFGHAGSAEISGARWIAASFSEIPAIVRSIERGQLP